jgi:hypothetical protein
VGYAVITFVKSPDLHGRYLIGLFLIAILVVWSPAIGSDESEARPAAWLAPLAWSMAGLAHASALTTILTRYF